VIYLFFTAHVSPVNVLLVHSGVADMAQRPEVGGLRAPLHMKLRGALTEHDKIPYNYCAMMLHLEV
jgi:hypothetical protein